MIKNYLKNLSFIIAVDSITKSIDKCKYRDQNICLYGIEYKNTIEYAGLVLNESFNYLKFRIFKSVFDLLNS